MINKIFTVAGSVEEIRLWVFRLYVITLSIAVIMLGSVGIFSLSISVLLMAAVSLAATLTLHSVWINWLFKVAVFILCGISIWILVQSSQITLYIFANDFWIAARDLAPGTPGSISIEPADTFYSLLYIALPFITFLTGLLLTGSDQSSRRLILALGIIGGLIAVISLAQFLLLPDMLLIYDKIAYKDSLTGVFVNRNSAGTFFGLASLILARQVWSLVHAVSFSAIYRTILSGGDLENSSIRRLSVFSVALLACVMALFLTQSRGAMGSTLAAFVVLLTLLGTKQGRRGSGGALRHLSKIAARTAIGLSLPIAVVAIFGGRSLLRAESQGTEDGRLCVLPGILRTVREHWFLGSGFGTFRYAFSPNRDANCNMLGVWERAHNFYLEGWIGLGVGFVVFFSLGFTALLVCHVQGIRKRRKMRSYSALGFASIVLVGLHSIVDFSLEIPGIAAYAAAILAATSSISLRPQKGHGEMDGGAVNFRNDDKALATIRP